MSSTEETLQATTSTSTTRVAIPGWKWAVVWTMFLATMLNYMDRQTMASTQVAVRNEFKLSNEGYATIEYYFGISFAIMQLFSGWMADRFSIRWVYAGALLVWSAAGFATGLADTIIALYACRVVLGIGESFNWVCAAGVVQRIIPREARSLANGIFHGGASVGAALTPLLAWWVAGKDGQNWRFLFQVVGAAGLLWAVLWFWLVRGERAKAISNPLSHAEPAQQTVQVPFWKVMTLRRFWVVFLYGTAVNLTWHLYRFWISPMLTDERHVNHEQLQYILCAFFIASDFGSLLAGWATRRLVHGGMSVERARIWAMFGCSALCLLSGPAAMISNMYIAIPLICVVGMGAMGGFASFYSMIQEISGPHVSRSLGVIGAMIWLLISLMQPRVGRLKDQIGTFTPMLIAVGFIPLIGSFLALMWPSNEEHERQMKSIEAQPAVAGERGGIG